MPLYQLYCHPFRKIYKASLFSKAALFQLITFALTLVCPLLIAYRSQGFWIKINTYRETPNIRFKYDYLIYLQGDRSDFYLVWTSFPGLAQLEDSHLRPPILRVYEPDTDKDGKSDYMQFKATFPIGPNETVREVAVVLIFDYRLELYSRFKMQTMIYEKYASLTGGVELNVNADMKIVQKIPLRYRGVDTRYDTTPVNRTCLEADCFRFFTILTQYHWRNVSTKLDSVSASWLAGQSGPSGQFHLNMRINYITDTFQYWTGFWELIKWAWIQYLSIFLIILFVVDRIREYTFRNRLITTVQMADQQPNGAMG